MRLDNRSDRYGRQRFLFGQKDTKDTRIIFITIIIAGN